MYDNSSLCVCHNPGFTESQQAPVQQFSVRDQAVVWPLITFSQSLVASQADQKAQREALEGTQADSSTGRFHQKLRPSGTGSHDGSRCSIPIFSEKKIKMKYLTFNLLTPDMPTSLPILMHKLFTTDVF